MEFQVSAIILFALGLLSFVVMQDWVMAVIFIAFGVISIVMGHASKALGLMAGLGGIAAFAAFMFFGFTVPFLSLFTIIAIGVAGAVTYFMTQ